MTLDSYWYSVIFATFAYTFYVGQITVFYWFLVVYCDASLFFSEILYYLYDVNCDRIDTVCSESDCSYALFYNDLYFSMILLYSNGLYVFFLSFIEALRSYIHAIYVCCTDIFFGPSHPTQFRLKWCHFLFAHNVCHFIFITQRPHCIHFEVTQWSPFYKYCFLSLVLYDRKHVRFWYCFCTLRHNDID